MNHQEALERQAAERYLLGESNASERDEFEEHFFSCRECAEDVRAGTIFTANLRAVFEEPRQPAASPAADAPGGTGRIFWLRPALWFPAAVAVCFLCVAAYQSLVVIPGLKRALAHLGTPRAYPAFFLRSVARGEEQVIAIPRSEPFVGISLDVPPERSYAGYECEITGEGGSTVVAAAAPARPGTPLNLLVPGPGLRPGRHTLILRGRDAGAAAVELGRYAFVLEWR